MKKTLFLIAISIVCSNSQNLDTSVVSFKFNSFDDDTVDIKRGHPFPYVYNHSKDTVVSYHNTGYILKYFNTSDSAWVTLGAATGIEIMFDYCKIAKLKIDLKEELKLKAANLSISYLGDIRSLPIFSSKRYKERYKLKPGKNKLERPWDWSTNYRFENEPSLANLSDTVIKAKVIYRKPYGENSYTEAEKEFYITNLESNYDEKRKEMFKKFLDSCQKVSKMTRNYSDKNKYYQYNYFEYQYFYNDTFMKFKKKYAKTPIYKFYVDFHLTTFNENIMEQKLKTKKDTLSFKKMTQKLVFSDKQFPTIISTIIKPSHLLEFYRDILSAQLVYDNDYEMQVKIGLQILKYFKVLPLRLRKLIPELAFELEHSIKYYKERGYYANGKIWLYDPRIKEYALKISKE